MRNIYTAIILAMMSSANTFAQGSGISTEDVTLSVAGQHLNVSAEIILDSLKLGSNRQVFVTPVVRGAAEEEATLPSLLI
ncbi:MAG: DUF3868 domain-containing protein, partial [Muribaculaceae bacterium]|nr:DUF3868 domain-containing protein [Muribaculaceae bacterium]